MNLPKNNTSFYLALICIFAIVTRVWFFWHDGLHTDEEFTWRLVQHDAWYIITYSLTNDCNPPLFYLIDHLSIVALGPTIFAERLPAVIFGILLIPATFWLGREIDGDTLGLFAAACMTTLGNIWYYSQFGRAYTMAAFMFVVFCVYYVRLMRGDNTRTNWLAVTLIAVLLAFTHLYAIIPITFMFGYLIWLYGRESLKWMALTFVLSSPLLLLFNAILVWRVEGRALSTLNWYGAPFNQLVIFAPLEFFGFAFVITIPLLAYSTYLNRKERVVQVLMASSVLSYAVLLGVCDITPVFLRYLIPLVPVWVAVAFLPVARFVDSPDYSRAQKWFVVGSFAAFYIGITAFALWSGLYQTKGGFYP